MHFFVWILDGKRATEQIMESENNLLADQLAGKVSHLKMVTSLYICKLSSILSFLDCL